MSSLLIYNIKDRAKLGKIKFICLKFGIKAKEIKPGEYGEKIGFLAGEDGFEKSGETAEVFDGEMLVLCNFTQALFTVFVTALKNENARVELKAFLTENNADWNSAKLFREISAEHEAMKTMEKKGVHHHH